MLYIEMIDKYGPGFEDDFKELMTDCSCNPDNIEEVSVPKGKDQREDEFYKTIREVYVDQTVNGGFSGDDYAGDIYFRMIIDNKWYKIGYLM